MSLRRLQTPEQRYKSLLETVPCGIEEIDTEGNLVYVSLGYAHLMGYTQEELIGQNLSALIPEEERDQVLIDIQFLVDKQPPPTPYTHQFLRKDLSTFYAHVNWNYIRDQEGDVLGFIVVISDITELERARSEAVKAHQAKSSFLSSMSHELRTPLNSVIGFSHLIQTDPDASDEIKSNIDEVLNSGHLLLELIDDLLELSLIESGKLSVNLATLDPIEIVEHCIKLTENAATSRHISVEFNKQFSHPVHSDARRLKEVILNLISNGLKYNSLGGTLSIYFEEDNARALRICIKDTGAGIPDEKKESVFEPFERLGHERSNIQGTGIGLTITKNLIATLNGNIGFSSEQGKGTTFWIDIPREPDAQQKHQNDSASAQKDTKQATTDITNTKVLYIEDSYSSIKLVEKVLRQVDSMTLFIANSAAEGIEITNRIYPDIILMDMDLPDQHGLETFKLIKKNHKTQHIPVIALTAAAMKSDIAKGLDAGLEKYLTKPVHIPELIESLLTFSSKPKSPTPSKK